MQRREGAPSRALFAVRVAHRNARTREKGMNDTGASGKRAPFPVLSALPERGERYSLLVRHAEREHIGDVMKMFDALLTEKGRADAFALGKELARTGPVVLRHSPVTRCRETAEMIAAGIVEAGGSAEMRGATNDLGGFYLVGDGREMIPLIRKHDFLPFVRLWFDGALQPGLMMPLADAARAQLAFLDAQLADDVHSYINVSHDWNVMLLREHYFNMRHDNLGAPAYLDGISCVREGGILRLRASGEEREVN